PGEELEALPRSSGDEAAPIPLQGFLNESCWTALQAERSISASAARKGFHGHFRAVVHRHGDSKLRRPDLLERLACGHLVGHRTGQGVARSICHSCRWRHSLPAFRLLVERI